MMHQQFAVRAAVLYFPQAPYGTHDMGPKGPSASWLSQRLLTVTLLRRARSREVQSHASGIAVKELKTAAVRVRGSPPLFRRQSARLWPMCIAQRRVGTPA
jgi:hypothetical protein